MSAALARAAAALLGQVPTRVSRLHGGDLSQVLRLILPNASTVIAKSGPAPRIEAAMLRALYAAGAMAPRVLAANDKVLVLEDLPEADSLTAAAWADLGAQLKRLHATTGPRYGWEADYAFGPLPIRNTPRDDWPRFWAANRLLAELPQLPRALHAPLERIAAALPRLLPAHPPASLLHGDLWAGNVITLPDGRAALIDPACYHGHDEVDLAMLDLFASPHPAFRESYGAPAPGWPARRAIYQLWPAIVHLRLFGAGYLPMTERLIAQIPL